VVSKSSGRGGGKTHEVRDGTSCPAKWGEKKHGKGGGRSGKKGNTKQRKKKEGVIPKRKVRFSGFFRGDGV